MNLESLVCTALAPLKVDLVPFVGDIVADWMQKDVNASCHWTGTGAGLGRQRAKALLKKLRWGRDRSRSGKQEDPKSQSSKEPKPEEGRSKPKQKTEEPKPAKEDHPRPNPACPESSKLCKKIIKESRIEVPDEALYTLFHPIAAFILPSKVSSVLLPASRLGVKAWNSYIVFI